MKSIILLGLTILSLGAARPDLTGRVTGADGRPIAGATAYVYTAGVKVGTSSFCPSCYADCGKTATSDAAGEFRILSLDPELKFKILLVAEGYKPAFAENLDPVAGNRADVRLDPMPTKLDPARSLKGRILNSKGEPVVGAIVSPTGCKTADRRWWGSMPGVDAMSISNARGEFVLTSDTPAIAYDLKVEARDLATQNFELLPLGETSHELRLGVGATVIGRLLKDGKPLANVEVGIVQDNRTAGHFTGAHTIGTDAAGRFTFSNIGPAGNWSVYGLMSGMQDRGAVAAASIRVEGDNTTADAGDLSVSPSYTVSGRVILSDGQPIPANSRLIIGREDGWDSQTVILGAEGHFSISGVPAEKIHLSVSVRGYHLARENKSLDLLNLTSLRGTVTADVSGLTVLLDPGRVEPLSPELQRAASGKWRQLQELPIEGVRREGVQ